MAPWKSWGLEEYRIPIGEVEIADVLAANSETFTGSVGRLDATD
jgi:hypothetical protein